MLLQKLRSHALLYKLKKLGKLCLSRHRLTPVFVCVPPRENTKGRTLFQTEPSQPSPPPSLPLPLSPSLLLNSASSWLKRESEPVCFPEHTRPYPSPPDRLALIIGVVEHPHHVQGDRRWGMVAWSPCGRSIRALGINHFIAQVSVHEHREQM